MIAFKDVLTHWETEANALYKLLFWSHQLTATTQLKTLRQLILRKFTADECTGAAGSMKLRQLGAFVIQSLTLAYSHEKEATTVGMRVTEHTEDICKNYVKLVKGCCCCVGTDLPLLMLLLEHRVATVLCLRQLGMNQL